MITSYHASENQRGASTVSVRKKDFLQEAMEGTKDEYVKIIYVSRPLIDKDILKKQIPSKTIMLNYLPVIFAELVLIYLVSSLKRYL